MNPNKTVSQILLEAKKSLKQSGAVSYALDAELLLMKVLNFTKTELFTKDTVFLTKEEQENYEFLIEERKKGVPVQYLLGECEFMGLPFYVNESVLIPRPDTEILIETVLEYHKKKGFQKVLDIGTGTGCIAVSIAHYTNMQVYAVDISENALKTAQKNAQKNHVMIEFIKSNLFLSFSESFYHTFDIIVSNPPYICTEEIETLMTEVKDFEPRLALDGGKDGLFFYREIVEQSRKFLKEDGYLFFEIGCEQAEQVKNIMELSGFEEIEIKKDLAGLDRVIVGKYKQKE